MCRPGLYHASNSFFFFLLDRGEGGNRTDDVRGEEEEVFSDDGMRRQGNVAVVRRVAGGGDALRIDQFNLYKSSYETTGFWKPVQPADSWGSVLRKFSIQVDVHIVLCAVRLFVNTRPTMLGNFISAITPDWQEVYC